MEAEHQVFLRELIETMKERRSAWAVSLQLIATAIRNDAEQSVVKALYERVMWDEELERVQSLLESFRVGKKLSLRDRRAIELSQDYMWQVCTYGQKTHFDWQPVAEGLDNVADKFDDSVNARPSVTLPDGSVVPDRLVTSAETEPLLNASQSAISRWINRKNDKLEHVDRLAPGPASRYWLGDLRARQLAVRK